ncbi:Methyltransferase domain-containing protein [Halogranum amylolyticum]|uniref:Methyltransferase domain-containing protein n=1 Tax=Halogranum amylolyticum TaxID=660520 RepID=A0A1H8RSA1_9EURY|nr:class I SAM-dependent methyltransferase [Halogranum amylolyticum]SEO69250.1 Methyltransferase domain-containing protein [Halogranum amylolyticum]
MTDARPARTFAEACEAVLQDPDGEHSLATTLAPLADRLAADAEDDYDRQFRTVTERTPRTAETVLAVDCGVGGLLPRLEARFPHVVGLDAHPDLLAFAERRVRHAVLEDGDVTDCDLGRRFDAVVAFEYAVSQFASDGDLAACFATVADHLAPDGVLVFDAVVDPVAVDAETVGVFTDERYRLERAVDVVPAPTLPGVERRIDYRVTDLESGREATTSERQQIRTVDVEAVQTALATAGFGRVTVDHDAAGEGAILVTARR